MSPKRVCVGSAVILEKCGWEAETPAVVGGMGGQIPYNLRRVIRYTAL
jgi:hypothetical protein